jgi:hypothetical protein
VVLGAIFNYRQLRGNTDLRCRQANTRSGTHRVPHILDKLLCVFREDLILAQRASWHTQRFGTGLDNSQIHWPPPDWCRSIRKHPRDLQHRIAIIVTDPAPGRGVYLIRQMMDEIHFENGRNEIRMWKF